MAKAGGGGHHYSLGVIYIVLTVIIWTAASFATQFLETNLAFNQPFVFTFISNSLFAINVPVVWLYRRFFRPSGPLYVRGGKTEEAGEKSESELDGSPSSDRPLYYQSDHAHANLDHESCEPLKPADLEVADSSSRQELSTLHWLLQPLPSEATDLQLLQAALFLMPLAFMGSYFYNMSLMLTTISSCAVITNLNGAFTLLFSHVAGVEEATRFKVAGVFLCFCGVLLVSWGDRAAAASAAASAVAASLDGTLTSASSSTNYLLGDFFALLCAISFGLYTTALKLKIPDSGHAFSMNLLFGYLGVANFVILMPVVVLLFALKSGEAAKLTAPIAAFIFGEELFDTVLASYLYARAAILTAPSVAAVGESLTIPTSIIADSFVIGAAPDAYTCIGGVLVTAGFIVMAWP